MCTFFGYRLLKCQHFSLLYFFILTKNFWYGLTEHEVRMWMMCQYLMKVP